MTITKDIKYVGVNDKKVDLFEGQYKVPNGISYNQLLYCYAFTGNRRPLSVREPKKTKLMMGCTFERIMVMKLMGTLRIFIYSFLCQFLLNPRSKKKCYEFSQLNY